jgi:hypothetical protein
MLQVLIVGKLEISPDCTGRHLPQNGLGIVKLDSAWAAFRVLKHFIDLYHPPYLINGPGINWRPPNGLRFKYEGVLLGQHGEYNVWCY